MNIRLTCNLLDGSTSNNCKTFILSHPQQMIQLVGYKVVNDNNNNQTIHPLYKLQTVQTLLSYGSIDSLSETVSSRLPLSSSSPPSSSCLYSQQQNKFKERATRNTTKNAFAMEATNNLNGCNELKTCSNVQMIDSNNKENTRFCTKTSRTMYQCQQCRKLFKHECNLRTHQQIHINPHICQICSKKFARKSNLVQHLRFLVFTEIA